MRACDRQSLLDHGQISSKLAAALSAYRVAHDPYEAALCLNQALLDVGDDEECEAEPRGVPVKHEALRVINQEPRREVRRPCEGVLTCGGNARKSEMVVVPARASRDVSRDASVASFRSASVASFQSASSGPELLRIR